MRPTHACLLIPAQSHPALIACCSAGGNAIYSLYTLRHPIFARKNENASQLCHRVEQITKYAPSARAPSNIRERESILGVSLVRCVLPNWRSSNLGLPAWLPNPQPNAYARQPGLEHFRLSGTIWCSNFSNNAARQMPICGRSYCLTTRNCSVASSARNVDASVHIVSIPRHPH